MAFSYLSGKEVNMIFRLFRLGRSWLIPVALIVSNFFSCEEGAEPTANDADTHQDWIKLSIPGEREALAVFGDIERTLVVATWYGTYFSKDSGNTWQKSPGSRSGVVGLLSANDTLFAMHATLTDSVGNKSATEAQHYSLDSGQNWQVYRQARQHSQPMDRDTTSQGTVYEVRMNVTNNYVNPSDLLRTDGGFTSTVEVPFKHHFHEVYVDQNDRVYVAVAGDRHNPEDNTLTCCYDALLYVSKAPNP
jgi:hypothetical protein